MTRTSQHKRVEAEARVRSSRAQYGLNGCIIWQRVLNPGCVVAWSHTHICIQTHRLKYTRIGSDALPLPGLIRRLHNRDRIDGMALRSPVHESKHVQEKRGRLCKDWCVIRVPVHTFYLSVCRVEARPCVHWRHISSEPLMREWHTLRQLVQYRPDHGRPVRRSQELQKKKTLQKIHLPDLTCVFRT